jgi:hypothetical protein
MSVPSARAAATARTERARRVETLREGVTRDERLFSLLRVPSKGEGEGEAPWVFFFLSAASFFFAHGFSSFFGFFARRRPGDGRRVFLRFRKKKNAPCWDPPNTSLPSSTVTFVEPRSLSSALNADSRLEVAPLDRARVRRLRDPPARPDAHTEPGYDCAIVANAFKLFTTSAGDPV